MGLLKKPACHVSGGSHYAFLFDKCGYLSLLHTDSEVFQQPQRPLFSRRCIDRLYRSGCVFKKCGIILNNLVSEKQVQANLFDNIDRAKSRRLMQAVDTVNARLDCPLRWAAEGLGQSWQVKFKRRSKRYTTRWDELPEVA